MEFPDDKIDKLLAAALADLKRRIEQLESGRISWPAFTTAVKGLLSDLYYASAIATAGRGLTAEERDIVERAIAEQNNARNKDFSLSRLLADYAAGLMTLAMLAYRLGQYLKSSRAAAWQIWGNEAATSELFKRYLGGSDHCSSCLLYAAMPAMRFADMVLPGQDCECRSNCLCIIKRV
ncbi:MAG: hypothetical protein U5M23_00380 [Marinagarivorans sp.]|nr:hypothetical protein [Marinagarivorans sp.]